MKFRLLFGLAFLPLLTVAQTRDLLPTVSDIQGSWRCVYSVFDDPAYNSEELPPYDLSTSDHVLFENDSMFELNYPCELISRSRIQITNGILHSYGDTTDLINRSFSATSSYAAWPAAITIQHDTLLLRTAQSSGGYTEKRYVRMQLDTGKVKWLKKYGVHVHCLYGTWKLKTTYDSGYDGNGMVNYRFPFQPQYTMVFTSNARIDYSADLLWLQVNGEPKPFRIIFISSDGTRMDVETMEWYRDFPYQLHYHKQ